MMHIMNGITDKPNWHLKVFDDAITSKWRVEMLATKGRDITEKMADWCFAELRYKARIFEKTGSVSVFKGDVVKSDSVIPLVLKDELKHAVAPLEDIPDRHKDWHPRSNGQVLDLVHPSLFPLVYGTSRILVDSLTTLTDFVGRYGERKTVPVPPIEEAGMCTEEMDLHFEYPYSRKFQWLPCDVDISDDEGRVRITSYINNLHPQKHADLYKTIEKIIERTIPVWNMTLTPLRGDLNESRIQYDLLYDPNPELDDIEGSQGQPNEETDDFYERQMNWTAATRKLVLPEPGLFHPPPEPKNPVNIRKDYGHRGLQIIVKLANIHLTPEKPKYNGGSWHIEGQLNEHICATALYYYDNDNIDPSYLAFRQQSDAKHAERMPYEQSEHEWLKEIYGCQNERPAVQKVGSVLTKEGRLLAWPNILQHRVHSFCLEDPTKPGHRKILALFLVDPNIRIISTANVPCQRKDWWFEAVQQGGPLSDLSTELESYTVDGADFPIDLSEAKALRLELMEERTSAVELQNSDFTNREFSLCEH
ncbi:hypothetical protein BDZ94DRAFT_7880 [Collybia nuda]|uniref:Uncharacterized protein n=1 Tax=Collybia nuda TaxID=64659 RepID=A0A9P5YIJ1_9AGAR|nr:hypothetical protein BDZ94DRAFT_7880 [Collybia nuda]